MKTNAFGMVLLGPFKTKDELINGSIEMLRHYGFRVEQDTAQIVTPKQLRKYLGCSASRLSELLNDPECPWFWCRRGPTGRILQLRLNAEASVWVFECLIRRFDRSANLTKRKTQHA